MKRKQKGNYPSTQDLKLKPSKKNRLAVIASRTPQRRTGYNTEEQLGEQVRRPAPRSYTPTRQADNRVVYSSPSRCELGGLDAMGWTEELLDWHKPGTPAVQVTTKTPTILARMTRQQSQTPHLPFYPWAAIDVSDSPQTKHRPLNPSVARRNHVSCLQPPKKNGRLNPGTSITGRNRIMEIIQNNIPHPFHPIPSGHRISLQKAGSGPPILGSRSVCAARLPSGLRRRFRTRRPPTNKLHQLPHVVRVIYIFADRSGHFFHSRGLVLEGRSRVQCTASFFDTYFR